MSPRAKGAYVTPGHQFPLGMTMSLKRRMSLLRWASRTGAFVIEDDYDSEYRFEGLPVPALQSLDPNSNVIFIGSFSKVLFPSLRVGYVVLPAPLVDYFLAFRQRTDFRNLHLDQAVLCDFIAEGHLGRHLRRMRGLYTSRLAALIDGAKQRLDGVDIRRKGRFVYSGFPQERNDVKRSGESSGRGRRRGDGAGPVLHPATRSEGTAVRLCSF